MRLGFIVAASLFGAMPVFAQDISAIADGEQLPDPLALEDALRLSRLSHPVLARLVADVMQDESRLELARSRNDWTAWLDVEALSADEARIAGHHFSDDSRASLYLSRLLTDFGATGAVIDAAAAQLAGAERAADFGAVLHDIEIMTRYLDARLADLRYFVDDEDMTIAFLRFDRVRERRERFGEFSEVDVLERETEFREHLVKRTRAANGQRAARNALALAMGRPGELANNLVAPDLSVYDRPAPDPDVLLEDVLESHPLIEASRHRIESAEKTIQRHRLSGRPELSARFEANEWSQETGNRDQYAAGIRLRMPLGGASLRNAQVADAMADKHRLESEHRALEYRIRQRVLELVQQLVELTLAAEAASVNERFRDLYLDRSRTLYQLEVRTDLGDSQARQAEAVWRSARVAHERALVWARLDAMRGMPLAVRRSEERR